MEGSYWHPRRLLRPSVCVPGCGIRNRVRKRSVPFDRVCAGLRYPQPRAQTLGWTGWFASLRVMGQPVAVVEKPSSTPGVVRYEANRSLSGQGHDRFESLGDAVGPTSSAEVARRLFGSGQVSAVHVFSNIITVDLLKGRTADGLGDIIRNLYQYWRPGMAPPAFEELVAEEAPCGHVVRRGR